MNIPPKYEDFVAQLETARAREAGYLEVIAQQADTIANQCRSESLIQQRLTDAEKRLIQLEKSLREERQLHYGDETAMETRTRLFGHFGDGA